MEGDGGNATTPDSSDMATNNERHESLMDVEKPLSPTVATADSSPRVSEVDSMESPHGTTADILYGYANPDYNMKERLVRQTNFIADMQGQVKDTSRRIGDIENAERNAIAPTIRVNSFVVASGSAISPKINAEANEESALNRLWEEQEKNAELERQNALLRHEVAHIKSQSFNLSTDVLRLVEECDRKSRELKLRTDEHNNTQLMITNQFTNDHKRMVILWQAFQQLRRDYADCRLSVVGELTTLNATFQKTTQGAMSACQKLSMWHVFRSSSRALLPDLQDQDLISIANNSGSNVEELIWENLRRLTEGQKRKDEDLKQLQIERDGLLDKQQLLEAQLLEQERQLETLKRSESSQKDNVDSQYSRLTQELIHMSQRILYGANSHETATTLGSPRRSRSHSPPSLRGGAAVETSLRMVREAFERQQEEINDLSSKLRSARQRSVELENLVTREDDVSRLEQEISETNAKLVSMQADRDLHVKEAESRAAQIVVLQNKQSSLISAHEASERHAESLLHELENFRRRVLKLESELDVAADAKEHAQREAERRQSETNNANKLLEATKQTLAKKIDEYDQLQAESGRLSREIRDLTLKNDELTSAFEKTEASKINSEAELLRSVANEKQLLQQLDTARSEIQILKKREDSLTRKVQSGSIRLKKLSEERDEYRTKRDDHEKTVQAWQERHATLLHEKNELVLETTTYTTQIEQCNTEMNNMKEQLALSRKEVDKHDVIQRQMSSRLKELEIQLAEHKNERLLQSQILDERDSAIQQIRALEEQIKEKAEKIKTLMVNEKRLEDKLTRKAMEFENERAEAAITKRDADGVIAELKRRIEDVQTERQAVESRAASYQAILATQAEVIETKESERKNLSGRVSHLEIQLRGRETQLKQFSDKFESQRNDLEQQMSEKSKLKEQLDLITAEHRRTEIELVQRNAEIQRLTSRLRQLEEAVEKSESNVSIWTKKAAQAENRQQQLQSELEKQRLSLSQMTESRNEFRNQLQSLQTTFSERSSSAHQETISQLQQQLRALQMEKQLADDRLQELKEQLAKSKKEAQELRDLTFSYETKATEFNAKESDLKVQINSFQKMLALSQDTENDLKRQLEQTTAQRANAQKHVHDLRSQVQDLEAQKRDLKNELMKLRNEKRHLTQLIDTLEKDKQKADDYLIAAAKERALVDSAVRTIEEENLKLNKLVHELQSQVARMEQTHVSKLMEASQSRQTEYEALARRIEQLESELAKCRAKIRSQEGLIVRLKDARTRDAYDRKNFVMRSMEMSRDVQLEHSSFNRSLVEENGSAMDGSNLPMILHNAGHENSAVVTPSNLKPLATSTACNTPYKTNGVR